MNIIMGQIVDKDTALRHLDALEAELGCTLRRGALAPETVVAAADALARELGSPEARDLLRALGVAGAQAEAMLREAAEFLSRAYLETKLERELGRDPFAWRPVREGAEERFQPLGALTHIAAGNAAGLPAFSVLEGLLAGNVNLLKLPGADDGVSTALLHRLIAIEPALAPYVYVFDLPSTDAVSIARLLAVSDAAAVWGSDFAVSGIRSLAPPNLRLIEWGHRLSFAYVTRAGETPEALELTAEDACAAEQLLCSSPQCVYYETDSFAELTAFAGRFAGALEEACKRFPPQVLEPGAQAEITALLALSEIEELIEEKKVLRGDGWSVVADMNPKLSPSPMYRTVWVKPLPKERMFGTLRPHKGYLQTVGLACADGEFEEITDMLYRCGVCCVMPCGMMAANYAGEPHDGYPALRSYVRTVARRRLPRR
jgi:hypothetical protein